MLRLVFPKSVCIFISVHFHFTQSRFKHHPFTCREATLTTGYEAPSELTDTEMVIGLVTPMGTDGNIVVSTLQEELRRYNYNPIEIRVSTDVMRLFRHATSVPARFEYDRICHYITIGDELRQKFRRNDILVLGIAAEIERRRTESVRRDVTRRVYIVNSLKTPEEVQLLRSIYGDGFYLWGVYTEPEKRIHYLKRKGLSHEQAGELINLDEDEDKPFGQKTRDTFHLADFFLNNKELERLRCDTDRYLSLMFGNQFLTPTFDEYAMFLAFAASLRSADLSRQVGAVITLDNEILSTGANEVPRPGGGQYWAHYDDKWEEVVDDEFGRDYKREVDPNSKEKREIIHDILNILGIEDDRRAECDSKLQRGKIWDITEYGRTVHAEMEALISCARRGFRLVIAHFIRQHFLVIIVLNTL